MPGRLQTAVNKTVGVKQTLKALAKGQVRVVFIASDAEPHIVQPVIEGCRRRGFELIFVDTMQELGRYCAIDVGAATAALLDE